MMPNPPRELARTRPKGFADQLVRVLDDAIRIPGTRVGVGLDALLGLLFPVFGDLAMGVVSLTLLVVAWRRRVPAVTIARMVVNILIDELVGALPVVGDLFDVVWRSNRKNLELIQRHERSPDTMPTAGDTLVVVAAFGVVAAAMLMPVVLLALYGTWLVRLLGG